MGESIGKRIGLWGACLLLGSTAAAAQEKSRIVEEIAARVNNEIITLSELERSRVTLKSEVAQDCPGCTPAEIEQRLAPIEKNLLRDLIDNLLLIQRAKDLGVNVDSEVVKRMDEILPLALTEMPRLTGTMSSMVAPPTSPPIPPAA